LTFRNREYTRPPMEWLRRNSPTVLLGVALAASATMLLVLMAGQTFFQDTWGFLLYREGISADSFLAPHNEHIAVMPVAINKASIALFGMTTAVPEQVVMALAVVTTALLLYLYLRRRLGAWPALIGAVLFLYLGPAWADMIWPFQLGFVGSALFGVAMLLALDRGDRLGDAWATCLLVLSLSFSSLGLSFLAAAVVDLFARRRGQWLSRVYVAAIPALLYAAWWVGWGHDAERHVTLSNVLTAPRYALEGAASAVEALLGLNKAGADAAVPPEWGIPVLVALIVLAVFAQVRRPGVPRSFWPVAAAATTNWLLEAFSSMPGREAYQNRYMYAGALFVLLLAAELLRDVRLTRRAMLVGGGIALLAVAANLIAFREGGRWLDEQTLLTRGDLGAVEIARRTVDPGFVLSSDVAGTGSLAIVSAGLYLRAIDEHGSPAYDPGELADAPPEARHQADVVLAAALPISTAVEQDRATWLGNECVTLAGGEASRFTEVPLSPGTVSIDVAAGPPAALSMRRFAGGEFPAALDDAPGGAVTLLRIPRDEASLRWYLHVESRQRATVCL
jgi:hypothetical protein